MHLLPIKEHQVLETLIPGLTATCHELLEKEHCELEVDQRHLVDCTRQQQLDCADRQLDRDRNSDLGPDFDCKRGADKMCMERRHA